MNAIETNALVREFKGGIRAVDGIDIAIKEGEIYGFLGPNGAGKSTTVLVLTTLLPPTSGTATVVGLDVVKQGPKVRRVIGAALQDVALDPYLTGFDHVRLQASLHGMSSKAIPARSDELLALVGLTQAAGRRVGGYSGGMRRRLDLALALVHRPKVLFLDEPTTGLDVQSRTALWDTVRNLSTEGVTTFLTTQYLEEADALAHRVGIIHKGKIVAEGTPAQLKATIGKSSVEVRPADPQAVGRVRKLLASFGDVLAPSDGSVWVRLDKGQGAIADIVRTLDKARIVVGNLALHAPSLDDVFLKETGTHLEGAADQVGGAEQQAEPVAKAKRR